MTSRSGSSAVRQATRNSLKSIAPLTRGAGNPSIAPSHPFELPDSIFDAFTPHPGVSPAVDLRSTTHVDIAELKRKSVAELHAMAETLNITNYSGLRKQDLIFRIEQSLLDSDTVLRGEGVLEILPEGYGFLYGPDDIYVSPSQIKRFDLRTGVTIMGQVRPPKEGERYLALLKVETVNGEEPEKAKHRVAFDNLRPRYPEERDRK